MKNLRSKVVYVGTSAAGHTAQDVDFLCTGTADNTVVSAALAALPATGGRILIKEGEYNFSTAVTINKDNVQIFGGGPTTVIHTTGTQAAFTVTGAFSNFELAYMSISSNLNLSGVGCVNVGWEYAYIHDVNFSCEKYPDGSTSYGYGITTTSSTKYTRIENCNFKYLLRPLGSLSTPVATMFINNVCIGANDNAMIPLYLANSKDVVAIGNAVFKASTTPMQADSSATYVVLGNRGIPDANK